MSQRFDPYQAWLGIPASERPASHYRLLGIKPFEPNLEVIKDAFSARMAQLNGVGSGPNRALSQRLLSEVSGAAMCLLRPAEKAAYDAGLRAALASVGQGEAVRPPAEQPRTIASDGEPPAAPSDGQFFPPIEVHTASPATSPAARVRKGKRRNKRRVVRVGLIFAQVVLAGVIGLAAGCFVLFLVNPNHPLIVYLSERFHSRGEAKPGVGGPPRVSAAPEPAVALGPPPAHDEKPPKREPLQPAPMHTAPQERKSRSSEQSPATSFVPPQRDSTGAEPEPPETPPAKAAAAAEAARSMTLDLTQKATYEVIAEVEDASAMQVQIEEVANMGTTYDLQPERGMVALGQPVDVVLAEYPGARFHLTLLSRPGQTVLKAEPQIKDNDGSQWTDLTLQRLERVKPNLTKGVRTFGQQLAAAQSEVTAIEAWQSTPGTKPRALRNQRKQRLDDLKNRIIPALQEQMMLAQDRVGMLDKLLDFVKQIDGKAEIHYVVHYGASADQPGI